MHDYNSNISIVSPEIINNKDNHSRFHLFTKILCYIINHLDLFIQIKQIYHIHHFQ